MRREVAINFVHYNRNYDRLAGCKRWALKTLSPREDKRSDVYTISPCRPAQRSLRTGRTATPKGDAGIAWAIGGKHHRAWGPERPIYGMIR